MRNRFGPDAAPTQNVGETSLEPGWRNALTLLIEAGLPEPGELVTHEWLQAAFGISPPDTIAEFKEASLLFLTNCDRLRDALLEQHSCMLRAVVGKGYEVVDPADQTRRAMRDRMTKVANQLARCMREVQYVRCDLLNDAQRAENSDAQSKLATLAQFHRKRLA